MANKDLQFYTEFILVTVLSLIAADTWVRVVTQTLNRFFPGSLKVDVIVAILVTSFAVGISYLIFSKSTLFNNSQKGNNTIPYYDLNKGKN